jgi:uncharacterized protein (TIGR04141 family)
MTEKKTHKLSIYLLKKDIKRFADALRDIKSVQEYKLKGTLKLDGAIYVGQPKENPASWVDLLQQGTDQQIQDLSNTSNRAIVFMKSEDRIFALPFGFGKFLLRDDVIEREFGLRTTLNIVDADRLRSMNKANVDDFTTLTTTQTSRRAKPQQFNLDIVRDLIRGVTGEPSPDFEELGSTVTGSEGIYIVPALNFADLASLLRAIGRAYRSRRYKARFDWIDNIKAERDPLIIEKLKACLVEDLKTKNNEIIHLAAPVLIDWESYEGFSITEHGDLHVDLNIDTYYQEKESILDNLTWDKLKSHRLFIKYGDRNERIPTLLLRSINYQKYLDGRFYVFAFGQWYKVNKNFSEQTIDYVRTVEESELEFIDCESTWDEKRYNEEFVASNSNYLLFDRKLVKSGAYRSDIELCDIFAENKEFVHVKFRSSSSTLSHLFAQGRISSNLLASDIVFRKNLRARLKELNKSMSIIPEKEGAFEPSKYIVTFAIIADGDKTFVESLPFFSLLNFRLTVSELRLLGFKVKMKKINRV